MEFRHAATARSNAKDQAVFYEVLVDENRVVVAGTGLDAVDIDAVDMRAYLE